MMSQACVHRQSGNQSLATRCLLQGPPCPWDKLLVFEIFNFTVFETPIEVYKPEPEGSLSPLEVILTLI